MPVSSPAPRWIDSVTVVVEVPGEVDTVNADKVRDEIISLIDAGARVVVADMTGTVFCDSAGVKAMAQAYRHAKANSSVLRVVTASSAVRRVFALTGVDRLIPVCTSMDEALSAVGESAP